MSDNNSKNLIEHTVKLLKLESQELNEYVVPGLPIGSGVVNRKERLRAEMERLARQQTMGRWSQSLTNPYTAHAGHMDNKFKGGYFLFDPKHNKTLKNKLKNSPDQYDEKDDYEKNETNESFSQYYGKATHHPMTKHGDPVQDSWNDQLRSRSGMMTQNNLKSYTEPYWNTTKTGPSTEKEFIDDIHKVNGILDGEDYIKSTFDNINNSVPFKSHGRDNDASPTYDAQTILPQIHTKYENDDSPTIRLKNMVTAYESVINGNSEELMNEAVPGWNWSRRRGQDVATGTKGVISGTLKGLGAIRSPIAFRSPFKPKDPNAATRLSGKLGITDDSPIRQNKLNHTQRIAYSNGQVSNLSDRLNHHVDTARKLAKTFDDNERRGPMSGNKNSNALESIISSAQRNKRPYSTSYSEMSIPLRKHAKALYNHIKAAKEGIAAHKANVESNSMALSHLEGTENAPAHQIPNKIEQYTSIHEPNASKTHFLAAQKGGSSMEPHHAASEELDKVATENYGLKDIKSPIGRSVGGNKSKVAPHVEKLSVSTDETRGESTADSGTVKAHGKTPATFDEATSRTLKHIGNVIQDNPAAQHHALDAHIEGMKGVIKTAKKGTEEHGSAQACLGLLNDTKRQIEENPASPGNASTVVGTLKEIAPHFRDHGNSEATVGAFSRLNTSLWSHYNAYRTGAASQPSVMGSGKNSDIQGTPKWVGMAATAAAGALL